MCGIAGYIGISAFWGEPVLRRMADAQVHRGPDGDGYLTDGLIGLAHRRLAVIDRVGGQQPLRSSDGRYAMVYNGEVYNYRELRAELTDLGHRFTTESDTEVVLAAWIHWGRAALDRFEGMFALAIADLKRGEVLLARDQFGIKPLYLAEDGDGRVFFASEIRPLFTTGAIRPEPDDRTIYRYLRFRIHDDTPRTFFRGVNRLMPGEVALLTSDGGIQRSTYTTLYDDMDALAAAPVPYDRKAQGQFTVALHRAIQARLVSDVPVGTALSGGLDSSTVVATIHRMVASADETARPVGATQQTFSAVFPGDRNDEERYVDAVAATCADALQVHKVHPTPDRFLVDLRDFVRTQEEPVISTAPYAQYCVMRAASEHVTVMLDGQGADEMLAGYLPYYLVHLRGLRGVRAVGELIRSLDVLWRLGRSRLTDAVGRRRLAPATSLLGRDFADTYRYERLPIVRNNIKARLTTDLFRHSLPALLRYEDRNSMRFSIEGRVPFLDTTLLRTVWSLDPSAIIHRGWNKRALRDATADLLPRLVHRRRNKIGFTTPEDRWFQRIKNDVYLIFASQSFGARPYFDRRAVLQAFDDYIAGRGGAETMTFWRMINVELWLREFIDTPPTSETDTAGPAEPGRVVPQRATGPRADEGVHPPAFPKPDFTPNPEKELLTAGGAWARFPLRTDLIATGDDVPALAVNRVGEFFKQGSEMPVPVQRLATAGRWYLFVSEKVIAVAQGRIFNVTDIRSGAWARLLSRFVRRTPYGIGLGHPATMQLAIQEAGLPRILVASAAGAVGKAVGRRGLFYQVAGAAIRAIDGPTEYSAYPANVSAKLAPADPARVAREISAAIRAALSAESAERFGGTVIIDANDFGQDILGQDTGATDAALAEAFVDNPLGQAREQTPFAIVVAQVPASGGHRPACHVAG
ncbi:asparagine synthase (glutamine-hydrolyzing) [Salinispora arenicola]|uniref:asparagine synthase (glutamine-hydrolyzing) n=1 Tax=Salinispora arenicola TaxID=168697 RepID=UPI000363CDCD|nr:asparagine synthase (glutamine-hydrolyzing) [Salinispora arenicola]